NSVIAISATNVQGTYWPPALVEDYVKILAPEAASRIMQDSAHRMEQINQSNSSVAAQQTAASDVFLKRQKDFLNALKSIEPSEVLNGTIYLYNWPPRK